MGTFAQPAPTGAPLDPAAELRATLAARVKLEELWLKFTSDTIAAQDQSLAAVANAQSFSDFSTQMGKILQAEKDLQTAEQKKDEEAKWLDEYGVRLIRKNYQIAERVEKELGKSSQLKWFESWERQVKGKVATSGAATTTKAGAGLRKRSKPAKKASTSKPATKP